MNYISHRLNVHLLANIHQKGLMKRHKVRERIFFFSISYRYLNAEGQIMDISQESIITLKNYFYK